MSTASQSHADVSVTDPTCAASSGVAVGRVSVDPVPVTVVTGRGAPARAMLARGMSAGGCSLAVGIGFQCVITRQGASNCVVV